MKDLQIAVLTGTLQELGVKYTVYGNTVIIKAHSEYQAKTLPGTLHWKADGPEVQIELGTFDLIKWISNLIIENEKLKICQKES